MSIPLTPEREAKIRAWRAGDFHPTHLHPDSVQALTDSLLAEVDRLRAEVAWLKLTPAEQYASNLRAVEEMRRRERMPLRDRRTEGE